MLISRKWAVAAVVALALTGSGRAADLDRYVPSDAEQVVVINVKQILGSELVKKHAREEIEKQLKRNRELQELQKLTGLDPLEDITSIVAANKGLDGEKVTVVVRGKFDTDKIHDVAKAVANDKKDELKLSKLGERNLYEITAKDGKTYFATFVDGTTLVGATSKTLLTTALESKGEANKELKAALKNVDGKHSMFMAGVVPENVRQQLANAPMGPAEELGMLKTVSGSVNLTDSLAVALRLSTGNEKAAEKIAEFGDQAKGLLGFAAASNKQAQPLVAELLKSLAIKSTPQGDVTIDFKIGEKAIDKAVQSTRKAPPKDN